MPAELNELFESLSIDADRVPTPAVSAVRARGRRRRRGAALVLTACLVAVAALTGTALRGWGGRPPDPATPAPTANFSPLTKVGEMPYPTAGPRLALTAIANGRGFAAWHRTDGMLAVAGVDLATGRRLWGPTELGRYGDWNGIIALDNAVMMIGEHDDGTTPDYTIFVLDPITGALRWQRGFDINSDDLVFFESVLALTDNETGVTEGLDWVTGAATWKVTDPSGTVVNSLEMVSPADLARPGRRVGLPATDNRLLQVGGDNVLRVYDGGTGRLRSSRPAVGGEQLAYDGQVFALRESPPELVAYPAEGSDAARTLFSAPSAITRLESLIPCGARRVCVGGVRDNAGRSTAEVFAVDIVVGGQVWRAQSDFVDELALLGDRLIGSDREGGVGLFGPDGVLPLVPQGQYASAGRVDAGRALLFVPRSVPEEGAMTVDVDVYGVVPTGEKVPLGSANLSVFACSWDTTTLLCPTPDGFAVWRFARP